MHGTGNSFLRGPGGTNCAVELWRNVRKRAWSTEDPEQRKSLQEPLRATRAWKQASIHQRCCLWRKVYRVAAERRPEWREAPSNRIWVRRSNRVSRAEVRPGISGQGCEVKYCVLALTCRKRALRVVHQAPRGYGFEAWRQLCRKFDTHPPVRSRGMLQVLLSSS